MERHCRSKPARIAMVLCSLAPLLCCGDFGAEPSPGENRANVPITVEGTGWLLHVPPGHKGPVELRFVDKPASVVEAATGKALPFTHNAGTAIIDLPASVAAGDLEISVSWTNDRYGKAMKSFAQADKERPPTPGGLLFVGSSTIRLWNLDRDFPGMNALNRGFGGSQYADAVFYFDQVILPYRPATLVLYDGDNDIAHGKSAEWLFADFEALMRKIRHHLPETRVVVLGIKPSVARWSLWGQMRQANAMMADYLGKQQNMHFVDISAPLLGPDGKPRPELFEGDGLHLNTDGYAQCAALLRPLLPAPAR